MKALLAATAMVSAIAGAAVSLSATPASAYVVCNPAGECWHTDRRYAYGPGVGVVYHPDDWYFHQHWDDHHRWRDYHEGRGYYREGVWIPF
jgi:hypothetical protein